MYLFNENTFRKLKERLAEEKQYNDLDRAMKEVLRKKLSSNDKWMLYRHQLYKFLNMRRRLMGYDPSSSASPAATGTKRKIANTSMPTARKTRKTHEIATDVEGLPLLLHPKKYASVQTDPPNVTNRGTNTRYPIRFDREVQVEPTQASTATDTNDLPPDEDVLTLSMFNDNNAARNMSFNNAARDMSFTGRPSAAAVANSLRPDLSFAANKSFVLKNINGVNYNIPFEDEYDFGEYAAHFYKTHKEEEPIDLDDFEDWLVMRHEQQDALVKTPDSVERRRNPGPYRDALVRNPNATVNTSFETSAVVEASTPKKGKQKKTPTNQSANLNKGAQPSVSSFYKQTKKKAQSGSNVFKWVSLR